MVKIRLMRLGKRKQPYFRVVVADSRSPRDGRIIEAIGRYHPRAEPSVIDIDEDRAVHWLKEGAQPSEAVKVLLRRSGIWTAFSGEPMPEPAVEKERRSAKAQARAKEAAEAASHPAEGETPQPSPPPEPEPAEPAGEPTSPEEGPAEPSAEGEASPQGG